MEMKYEGHTEEELVDALEKMDQVFKTDNRYMPSMFKIWSLVAVRMSTISDEIQYYFACLDPDEINADNIFIPDDGNFLKDKVVI